MKLLALETATEACSAALWDGAAAAERYQIAPRRHAELILPMVEELLVQAGWRRADLEALAFGRGPGSFTGVRLAASVAQGIAFGLDLPVAPVSTLAAIAHRAWRERGAERVIAAIDARMQEVYWGAFEIDRHGRPAPVLEECVVAPDAAPLPPGEGWFVAGTGWGAHEAVLGARLGAQRAGAETEIFPHARDVAELGAALIAAGAGVSARQALPVYLRDEVARKPG